MHAFFRSRRLLLAPMAGVSDEAFRTLCREQGADLTYTEMVSAKGLSYANEKTRHLLRLAPDADDPIGHLVDRHDRRLFEDDPPPFYIYQYRCRTEVNRNIPTHRTSFRYIIS